MRTNHKNNEEQLEILLGRLNDVQQLSNYIDTLKIELNNEISKLKGKQGKSITDKFDYKIKQGKRSTREIKATEENSLEGKIAVRHEELIKNIKNKPKELKSEN